MNLDLARFADGRLTAVTTDGSRVSLRLEAHTGGRFVPGEVSVFEVYELSTDRGELAMAGPPAADHTMEEPSCWEADGLTTAEFFAPLRIRVTASAFELTLLRTDRRPVLPEPSANACTLRLTAPLDPARWQEALGPTVAWRILGGDAGTPADPDGWFLQRRDRLATSRTGVFCRTAGGRVTLDRHDADDELWQAVRLLAAESASRVWCGNCVFAPADWVTWLTTGALPPLERLVP
ncbi:hypothetical protein [Amycolatopsis sp. WQ 127309]|uniref:hypothetical protein n=1 Tax=Amycolatopsis sp. WQ 127309 TaxID=2932773 RepID=UPI001FF55130|nr:hypothetical protein [Amycolatopsis sp. WQ 127309]UOZ09790.1 hypothetical protein MUY22_16545 [Amycolatopsis sp. WQ 127309]